MNKSNILVIDDEPQIRKLLEITFESQGYQVLLADNARTGLAMAASYKPDIILLDLELPDRHGLEVLSDLKIWFHQAVLILSVIDTEDIIVKALDAGADDYLTKPFRSAELIARVRNAIKRNQVVPGEPVITCNDITIDFVSHRVTKNQEEVKLTATEYKLLSLFMKHVGKVLTQPFLLQAIWGSSGQTEAQYLRVFIGTLRKKIEDDATHPKHIITESGIGYRFM